MARQLNVNLVFNANTQQAKQQMASLQASINQVQTALNSQMSMNGLTAELSKAQNAVISLKTNLNSAFDVNTGKLDMSKFNQQMKLSGQTIQSYRQGLQQIGPEGVRAFNQLSQSVMQAQMPIHQTKNLLTTMMDTFGSSIKWSLAYGAINKISQGFQEAFQYAQDLNQSLVDIRVVTGLGADEMVRFAETANRAAKALATTTTDYTKAALIYYQQGLEGKAVEERAETTLKLANVTGQTAEVVSDQMTAVWNNFYDGSKSLEYYADVLTALGAATASSTDEISQGLEKFAAVAETVGLSYEYATTALATVTAQTRQSADVVGTAFKTLFARIQDLELGETLDDGTTLGSYSEALYKVGVDIKDSQGNLKDMNDILDEMGAKWQQIDKDEQVALAKSVAGIRQYTQLIALMDNWDTFEMNLTVAETAEGTLQEQQEIWADSWEAAQKRVKAAGEDVYNSLIDDQFFIDLNNAFADLLSGLDDFIEAMGGLKTLIPLIGSLILKAFGPMALSAISGFTKGIMGPSKAEIAAGQSTRLQMVQQQGAMARETGGAQGSALADMNKEQMAQLEAIEGLTRNISKQEAERLSYMQQENAELANEILRQAESVDLLERRNNELRQAHSFASMEKDMGFQGLMRTNDPTKLKALTDADNIMTNATNAEMSQQKFLATSYYNQDGSFNAQMATMDIEAMKGQAGFAGTFVEKFDTTNLSAERLGAFTKELKAMDISGTAAAKAGGMLTEAYGTEASADIAKYTQGMRKMSKASAEVTANGIRMTRMEENLGEELDNYSAKMKRAVAETKAMNKVPLGEAIIGMASGIGMAAAGMSMAVNGVQSALEMFKTGEHTLSGWLGILTSVGFALPMVANGFKSLATAVGINNLVTAASTALQKVNNEAEKEGLALDSAAVLLKKQLTLEEMYGIGPKTAGLMLDEQGNLIKSKAIPIIIASTIAKKTEAAADGGNVIAKLAHAAANWVLTASMPPLLAITLILMAALVAIAAVIATVVAVVKGLSDAYNADAIAAEKAREEAKALAEAYNEVKQKFEELKQSITDYKDAQKAIDELKEGTKEWRDAVSEANIEILELLDKYPELAQYVQTLEGGRMIITDEGLAKVQAEQAQNVATMANVSASANLRAKQAELRAERTDLLRNTLTHNDTSMTINGVIGTAVGAAFGPGGAVIGAAIPTLMETVQTAKMDTLLEELAEKYEKEGASAFIGLEEQLKALGVASDEAAEEVRNLIIEQQNLKDTEELIAQSQIDNILNSQSNFNAKSYGAGMQKIARELGDDMVADKNFSADAMHEYDKNNLWYQAPLAAVGYSAAGLGGLVIPAAMDAFGWYNETSTEIGDEAFKKYLKAQGLSDDDVKSINFTKNGEITYKQRKEEGSAEFDEKRLSYEALADFAKQDYLAEHAAEIALAMNNLMATTRTLSLSNDTTSQALASYLAEGDLSMMSPDVYNDLKNSTAEDITNIFNENATVFQAAGIASAEELINGFDKALANYDPIKAEQNILNKKWADFNQTISTGAKELEISESTLKTYTETLIAANGALGDNIDVAGKTAVAHFKLAKGVEKVQKAISDNIGILETGNTNSLEYAEALGEVRDAVTETFGMNVSASFVEENLSTIKSMADGSVEAFKNLQKLLVEDFVIGLQLEDNAKETLQSELDSLLNEVEGLEVNGTLSLDNTDAIAALNTALENGSATKEELEALFSNMNLAFPDTTITTYKKPTRTTTFTENTIWDGTTTKNTKTKSTVTSEIELPWIGDNPPQFKKDAFGAYEFNDKTGEAIQIENTGKSNAISGLSKTAEMSSNDLKQILNYDIDAKGETATDRKKRLKDLDNEVERYHEIDESIQNIERNLDRLSKAKDRAFGKSKLNIIEQEIEQQKELIALTEQRAKDAAKYYQEDKQYILDNYAVKIDSEGKISNYEDLIREQTKKLRGIEDSESQEYKDTEKYLNQMKEDFAQYEESLETLKDEQQNVIDKNYELQDQAMERIEFTVQLKVDAADDDLARIDFLMQTIEDDAFKAADAIGLLGDQAKANIDKYNAAKAGFDAIAAGTTDLSPEAAIEQLRQYRDDMIEANATLLELRTTVQDKLTEAYDAWNEKLDKNAEKFEFYTSVIDNYKNIIDIVGKDNLGISNDMLKEMNEAAMNNANNAVRASQEKLAANEAHLADLQKKRAAAVAEYGENSWQVEDWDEQIEYTEEQVRAATEEFNDNWSSALETTAESFSAHVDLIIENFSESVSGIYKNLEQLQEAFDRQTEVNDRYLAQYEKTYEINKLNRSIQDSIDKTDNVGSQKELRKLQQDLLVMNEAGVEVSQRDIEFMQKKYDLMVAEQAFKDAQNAKSVVRLQRDSEGNFGYVYTADQNNVDQAQQNYEDKLYAMQKFGDESLQEISEQLIAVNTEFSDALKAIEEDSTLSLEEKKAKAEEITQYYTEKLQYWTNEASKQMQYGSEINSQYNANMASSFHDTVIGKMFPDSNDFTELFNNNQASMKQASSEFVSAVETHKNNLKTTFDAAGKNMDSWATEAKKDIDKVTDASNKTAAAAKTIADKMKTELPKATSAVSTFQTAYSTQMAGIRSETETTIGKIGELLLKYEALAKAAQEDYTSTDYSDEGTGDQNGDKNLGGNGKNNRITLTNKKGADSKDFTDAQGNTWHQGSNKLWYQAEQGWNGYKNEGLNGDIWTLSWDANTKGYSNEELAKLGKKYTIAKDGVKIVQDQTYYKIGNDWYNGKDLVLPNQGHSVSGDAVYLLPNAKPAILPKLPKEFSLTTGSGWNDATWFSRFNQDGSRPNFWTSDVDDYHPNQTFTITGRTKNKKAISLWNNAQHYLYQVKFDTGYTGWFAGLDLQQVNSKFTDRYIDENYDLPKFDTGGYTGSWGPEGRLAMLHQKEIVLNAHDTANLLTAVDIVRSMADKLEMNASLASQGIAGLTASIIPYHGGDTLEQNVTIHAEFPNATNHSEIEEAFGNLVNLASQYANRK